MARRTKKKTLVQAYLLEEVNFGGERMPRGTMIQKLQRMAKANGLPMACVDLYLLGIRERERKEESHENPRQIP